MTSVCAFSFDLWRLVLQNVNVWCERHHELPWFPLLTFDANADVMYKQGLFTLPDADSDSDPNGYIVP